MSRLMSGLVACIVGNFFLRVASALAGTLLALALAGLQGGGVRAIHFGMKSSAASGTLVGMLAVGFYLAELLGAPIFGALSDRQGRRRYLLLGPIFGAVAVLLLLEGKLLALLFPAALIAVRVCQGLSTASSAPSTLGYLAEATSESTSFRARVMAAYEVSTIGGLFAGTLLGAFLWDALGSAMFVVALGLYGLSAFLFFGVREVGTRISSHHSFRRQFSVLGRASLLRFAPAWIAVNALIGAWMTHGAFQAAAADDPKQLLAGGYTGPQIGYALAAVAICFTAGMLVWNLFIGKVRIGVAGRTLLTLGPIRVTSIMLIGLGGALAAALLLYVVNHSEATSRFLLPLLVLLAVAVFTLAGFTPAALVYLADISEESATDRGIVMGAYSVFLGVGQLLGGWLGGPFSDLFRVDGLILLTTVLALVATATVLPLHARAARPTEEPAAAEVRA